MNYKAARVKCKAELFYERQVAVENAASFLCTE